MPLTPTLRPSTPTATGTAAGLPVHSTPSTTRAAYAYLTEALDAMEADSLYRDEINWPQLRREAFAQVAGATAIPQTYPAIRDALARLADGHSALITPSELAARKTQQTTQPPRMNGRAVADNVAYLPVPPYKTTGEAVDDNNYAEGLARALQSALSGTPCGIILDLRGNSGGNSFAMLAGLAALLGDGPVGTAVYPRQEQRNWLIDRGRALSGDRVMATSQLVPTIPPGMLVAVLQDRTTASSGESVAIAFRGAPTTRTFGQPTFGLTTVNDIYWLPDGAFLALTTSRMADRTGRVYAGPIDPDTYVSPYPASPSPGLDPVLQQALAWLQAEASCSRPQSGDRK